MARKQRLEYAACYHRFDALLGRWAIGSDEFRTNLLARMNGTLPVRFSLLGTDHEAVREARMEAWEERLRALAGAFGIALDRLPVKKSIVSRVKGICRALAADPDETHGAVGFGLGFTASPSPAVSRDSNQGACSFSFSLSFLVLLAGVPCVMSRFVA